MNTRKITKLAGTIGTALAVAYASSASATITEPGGFAQAFMHFTDFQFRIGDNKAGLSEFGALGTAGTSGTEVSNAVAFLNGVGAAGSGCGTTDLGEAYTCLATIGAGFAPSGSTTPQTVNPLAPAGNGSGSLSSSLGDSRTGTAEVYLHSLSQLNAAGNTNAGATQDLFAAFSVDTSGLQLPGLQVELSFLADRFVRAGLGQAQRSASATTSFTVNVKQNNNLIFSWSPNGGAGGLLCAVACAEFSDAFTLNSNISIENQIADRTSANDGSNIDYVGQGMTQTGGFFEAEVFLASGFIYDVEIIGRVTSSTRIPEPGTIALLGLGLLGLGGVLRKKQ
jgi:hypothetical protein